MVLMHFLTNVNLCLWKTCLSNSDPIKSSLEILASTKNFWAQVIIAVISLIIHSASTHAKASDTLISSAVSYPNAKKADGTQREMMFRYTCDGRPWYVE